MRASKQSTIRKSIEGDVSPKSSVFKVGSECDSPETKSFDEDLRDQEAKSRQMTLETRPSDVKGIRYLTNQTTKPSRPRLGLTIPLSTAPLPVLKSGPSPENDVTNLGNKVEKGPICSSAYAESVAVQSGATSTPQKATILADELGRTSFSSRAEQTPRSLLNANGTKPFISEERNISVHDWALEQHKRTSRQTGKPMNKTQNRQSLENHDILPAEMK